jgi:hypothetical protein
MNNPAGSPFFTWKELTDTTTGLFNEPNDKQRLNLSYLVERGLHPLRLIVGPIRITSGYRSPEVNAVVKGSSTSQHMKGEAADWRPLNVPLASAWWTLLSTREIRRHVDQAIVYEGGWIHLSMVRHREPRKQYLIRWKDKHSGYPAWQKSDSVRLRDRGLLPWEA